MNTEWIDTAIQTIPKAARVVRRLAPTFELENVLAVDDSFLETHQIKGVVWDVDGTLMDFHALDIAPEFRDAIRASFKRGNVRHAILSNCDEPRFVVLGGMFPEIPVFRGYQTDQGPIFRKIEDGVDTHSIEEAKDILKRGGRQIRKPDGRLIKFAAESMGMNDPSEVIMVGDQYLTDVAEANLGGARSVKVPTFRRDTFPAPIRVSQRLEAILFRVTTPLHIKPSRGVVA